MSVYKKFAGQTALYGLSTVLARVLNFFLTPLYVRVFATRTYGIFTNMYSWASVINALLSFGMETTYFRYLNKHPDNKQDVYSNSFWVVGFLALLFLVSGLVFAAPVAAWLNDGTVTSAAEYRVFVRYFVWILFFDALSVIPFAKLRAEGRPGRYALIKMLNIGLFIGLNLFFLFAIPLIIKHQWAGYQWIGGWYKGVWIGYVFLSNLVASVVTFACLLPDLLSIRFRFNRGLFADMFSYSWPVLVANLSFIINENLDKIVLKELLPSPTAAMRDTGIYGACAKIAVFLSIFIQAFRLGAEPFFFNNSSRENSRQIYAAILDYFVIALSVIFVALVANIELLKYFIRAGNAIQQAEYWSGLPVVPLLLFGYVCLGIYSNLSVWYRLSDQTRFGLYISGIGAVITIVLNIILIPKYSYIGSAWVSAITYFTMMVISYILGQKYYPIPYRLKKNIGYIVASLILVILSFWVFNRNIWIGNALLFAFMGWIGYSERSKLAKLIKTIR